MTDFSFEAATIRDEIVRAASDIAAAHTAPSHLYRPRLFPDGDQWCALLGDNLQEGVCGFGETPAAAMAAFDQA